MMQQPIESNKCCQLIHVSNEHESNDRMTIDTTKKTKHERTLFVEYTISKAFATEQTHSLAHNRLM
jgi:hypothetical protein